MDETTREGYVSQLSKHVARYDKNTSADRSDIQSLIKVRPPPADLLDLGCGPGAHSKLLQKLGYQVTAADILPEMVEICKSRGVKAVVDDARNLSFDENSFDVVWCCASLLHLTKEDFLTALKSIKQVLKSEGIIYVGVKAGVGQGFTSRASKRFFRYWSADDLRATIELFFEIKNFDTVSERGQSWHRVFAKKLVE